MIATSRPLKEHRGILRRGVYYLCEALLHDNHNYSVKLLQYMDTQMENSAMLYDIFSQ